MVKEPPQNRVRLLRKEAGLTQKELADKVGVIRRSVGNWESGYCRINPEHTETLAALFNVSVPYLLGTDSERDSDKNPLKDWVTYHKLSE
ncbi:helix-turn-helix domain-containing protein [Streptococcus pluranimalium]|uniref:helix-turn-helix domain-containing protein n=1 Tax=Streptococcus pluranimalium TaxID=82348 RepID=UPI0039FD641A